ncbi:MULTISPECIES: phospholipid scramblase-related protein [Flavobacterium]|uniref:Phospholipid scramblase-related protein n=1 Tax=Flavobacterium ginsengisoli TaxID=871694 RepID=A0ABP7FZ61_9FLAO|nr:MULTISPECIES: phospholipid scramblase-related protein [Flavobacterium]MBJ2127064.1 RNAase [Flavobacterium sp. IB48]
MNPILSQNLFLVKEHIGMFKAANNYDIYHPENNQIIMNCRENNLGFFTKIFRFTDYKRATPFNIEITTASGEKLITVRRDIAIFRSTVEVLDEKDHLIGTFKQKFFSIGGKFDILDKNEKPVATLQGKWTGWDFKFSHEGKQLAQVNKKWAGLGKEFFTTADNYALQIEDSVPADSSLRQLILGAVMCIDMVLKE